MSAPWATFTVLALVAAVLAGCFDDGNEADDGNDVTVPVVPEDWAFRALDTSPGHDHSDVMDHLNRSTPNFETLAWDPLATEYHGGTSGGYLCGDVSEEGERRIGVAHSFDTDVALVTVDLTDPMHPEMLGELVLPHTFVYDVAVTPDARYAILGTNDPDAAREKTPVPPIDLASLPTSSGYADGAVPLWRDACTGEEHEVPTSGHLDNAEFGPGVVLVDISTPEEPTILDYKPLAGLGAHSVFATQFDDDYRIVASVTNLAQHASYYAFYTILELPAGPAQLVPQAVYTPEPPAGANQAVINGHVDGWIQVHPATQVETAYLANWDGGLLILDVSDPNRPEELGRWTDFAGQDDVPYDDDSGSIHEALPLDTLWNDRHYTIIGQEVIGPRDGATTGAVFVMDTTDPTDPHPVSAWTLPVEPVWDEDILYSTHYVTIDERMLFVTMYHGGVWAVDLTDPEHPRTSGVYVPANEEGGAAVERDSFAWTPVVLEAEVIEPGVLAVWDGNTGIYTVRYDHDMPIPPVDEWPMDALLP